MKECPYCKEQMKKGFIPTEAAPPQWIPEDKKVHYIRFCKSKDGIEIPSEKSIQGRKAIAYFCENCKVVILNTKQDND